MQDRSPPARRNHLQRTAGPYIQVNLDKTPSEHNESAIAPKLAVKAEVGDRAGMGQSQTKHVAAITTCPLQLLQGRELDQGRRSGARRSLTP
jgi:hypothetical protein